ncbi:MAG: metal-dependent hydrolase [Gammaproteobacteria bacterium]|nr:metal-dependent hydrolase [Gammaproteobacteria bacterium]
MDTLTHALSGALLGRATEAKTPRADQLPRRTRMWVGFVAAAFPDSDFVASFIDPLTYLTTHRGITHSVILLPLWAIVLALLFMLLVRKKYSWRAFVGICALGIGAHIAGDVITAFGTMIFAPFSDWRAQFPVTFIIDPYFTAIIIAGLIASAYWKDTRKPAVIGLVLLVSYVGFQTLLHQRAINVGKDYAAKHQLEAVRVEAIPQPLSPFNWMIVISQTNGYYLSYISLWRDQIPEFPAPPVNWFAEVNAAYFPVKDAMWKHVARFGAASEANLAQQLWYSDVFKPYRRFAQFPAVYRVDREKNNVCVWFNDLRFALAGRTMPFRYGACRQGTDSAWHRYLLGNDHGQEILDAIPH